MRLSFGSAHLLEGKRESCKEVKESDAGMLDDARRLWIVGVWLSLLAREFAKGRGTYVHEHGHE